MAEMGKAMVDIDKLLTNPPKALVYPQRAQRKQQRELQSDIDQLSKNILKATENLLLVDDARTRQELDQRVTAMRDEREGLQAKFAAAPEPAKGMDEDGSMAGGTSTNERHCGSDTAGQIDRTETAKNPGAVFYRDPSACEEQEQLVLMIDPKRSTRRCTLWAAKYGSGGGRASEPSQWG